MPLFSDATAVYLGPAPVASLYLGATALMTDGVTGTRGALAGVAPVPSGALTGTVIGASALAGTVRVPSGALTGTVINEGALAGVTPLPRGALDDASANTGALAGTTPMPVGALAGAVWDSGALAGTTPKPVGALTGVASATTSYDWTGTTGAAWPSPWVSTAAGGSITIQSNRGRITTQAAGYVVARASRPGVANGELLLDVTLATTAEHYVDIEVRGSSTTAFGNGYSLSMDPAGGGVALTEWAAGADTPLDTAAFTFAATTYRIRFLFDGSSLKAKVWAASGTEPSAWTLEATDATVTAAGSVHLAVTSGAATVARSVTFDNYALTDLDAAPAGDSTAATAFGWGAVVAGTEDWADVATILATGTTGTVNDWAVVDGVTDQWGTKSQDQVTVTGGVLQIVGSQVGGLGGAVNFFGGPSTTIGGRWEWRGRVTQGDWTWKIVSLLWPFAEDWPEGGEVDYVEAAAGNSDATLNDVAINFNLHYGAGNTIENDSTSSPLLSDWHHYAVEWVPGSHMTGYVDGVAFFTTTNLSALPPRPMWHSFQLDHNLDGDDSLLTSTIWQIDWLRIYEYS